MQYCGAPYATPGRDRAAHAQPNPGSANATDQYVPKHFPFPWFESILHVGRLQLGAHRQPVRPDQRPLPRPAERVDDAGVQLDLAEQLQRRATTPSATATTSRAASPTRTRPTPPLNYTGGLYASDLFLEHVVPEIEASPAFKDGGLIDITFDEAFPPFTYTGNSFANSTLIAAERGGLGRDPTRPARTCSATTVHTEPTGPNTPLAKDASGNELYPGPGDNAYIDRPTNCVAQTVPVAARQHLHRSAAAARPAGARTDARRDARPTRRSTIADNSIVATDAGRTVSGTGIPAGAFVGTVTDTPAPRRRATRPAAVDTGSSRSSTRSGNALDTTGAVSGVTLGARQRRRPIRCIDATDATNGGGDTGSVLISPYIKPGTRQRRYYNHYSWLRTMEDLFDVAPASPGLDGEGHIGYAAQPGLAPFGPDVFTNPAGRRRAR